MTKTLSMVSHTNYNLNANGGFVVFLTSKLITCFINGFTLKKNSINCLLYSLKIGIWVLKVKLALNMGFVDKWPSRMQGQLFF